MSNWELRPLRQSQVHYAALDANILVSITKKLDQAAEKPELRLEKYTDSLIDGKLPKQVDQEKSAAA